MKFSVAKVVSISNTFLPACASSTARGGAKRRLAFACERARDQDYLGWLSAAQKNGCPYRAHCFHKG